MKAKFISLPIVHKFILGLFFLFTICGYSQTTVSSISQLLNYVDRDNVNIKMKAGTYTISASDVASGLIDSDDFRIIEITGSNSTYDFTGVTIRFNTNLYQVTNPVNWGRANVNEFVLTGDNNVVKNLTIVEFGGIQPWGTALAVYLAGYDNRVEGFHVTTSGSSPYGYGDMFGKGNNSVIGHHKHSGYLIHGDNNHLLNSTLIMKTYGHGIFFGGTNGVTIEGCYVEGELNTTDNVLAERGTGSPADNVDFLTVFGYTVPAGWKFSNQEDGIRAYQNSPHYLTGETVDTRGTTIIKNCTVKNMRSGVTIGLQKSGPKYVENVTVLGCEIGFWGGDNVEFVNCRGDASVGPLYSEDIERSNAEMDFTILDNSTTRYGNTALLHIGGSGHNMTLKDARTSIDSNLKILVGGTRYHHRFTGGQSRDCRDATIENQTESDLIIGSGSNDNDVTSCGDVTNNGSGNNISNSNDCGTVSPTTRVVHIRKRNATSFALDGGNGGANGQDLYLWGSNTNNSNQQWVEMDRGNGYYSYQKNGTNFCIDGGRSGVHGQNVYLWDCGANNQNQHWQKVNAGGGAVKLVKRNASSFALNGGSGGANGNSVSLTEQSTTSQNIQWFIAPVGAAKSSESSKSAINNSNIFEMYPNPVTNILSIKLNDGFNKKTPILLYNINGQKVMEANSNSEVKLDLSSLSAGIYFLNVNNTIQKVIKVKN